MSLTTGLGLALLIMVLGAAAITLFALHLARTSHGSAGRTDQAD